MAARSKKKQNGSGVLPWIALLLLAVVVATFVYAHVHVVSQHGTAVHPHMPPPRARQLEEPVVPTMIATPAPSPTKRRKTINDVAHELDPMDRLLEQSRMRVEAGKDVCADDVFIVHWTHVPKAGGTAFAGMAKKISCARNPSIASSNPCCVRAVCVAEGSCHSTASTCPLVQGIGKHTSNMGRLALVPCCGREWYLSTVISFLRYAIRPAPTNEELARFGLAYDPRRPYHPVKIRVMISTRWRRGDGTRRTGCLVVASMASTRPSESLRAS